METFAERFAHVLLDPLNLEWDQEFNPGLKQPIRVPRPKCATISDLDELRREMVDWMGLDIKRKPHGLTK